MDRSTLLGLLEQVREGTLTPGSALERLAAWPYEDLGFAKVDHHRWLGQGFPEVIYCPGKAPEQVVAIAARLRAAGAPVLVTRVTPEALAALGEAFPDLDFRPVARLAHLGPPIAPRRRGTVAVVSAGTADLPVAEEAAVCAEVMGNPVERLCDVGIAGLHRLLDQRESLRRCRVIVAVAGMEGALPSVLAGLTPRPVVAVPTSVGYGASLGGIAALLTMLNSCVPRVGVVNIDNGFGAASLADAINRLVEDQP
ncbi:MAG: nickel pincer cofactor biosynthesis protein LarB [Thermaerobacter sp.]|nr:nickel pincer cofactor biosynthesis protein LarB [Thermaerobacter sp.]